MNDEQIKQNAEEYILPLKGLPDADENITFIAAIREAFVAGAHSRDEEIESLQKWVSMWKYKAEIAEKELSKLHNPWHKASDELPPISEPREESADCLLAVIGRQVKVGCKTYLTGFYDHEVRDWHIYGNGYSKMTNIMVLEWQLIQKQ